MAIQKGANDWDKRMGDAMAQVHAKCKDQIYTSTLSQEPVSVKLGNQMLSLHGGHIFGPFAEVINVITGLALSLLSISGIYVFLKTTLPVSRKRKKRA